MSSYPGSVKNFGVDRVDGDYIPASDINEARAEIVAMETDLLAANPLGLVNGKFVVTVAGNNLSLALKTLAGTDPTAADRVRVRIGDVTRNITAALSVSKNAGTNWCNAGSAELAAQEVDYFIYLGYNAALAEVVLGFSRIPWANLYSDFSSSSTAESYCGLSTTVNAASGDNYVNVGRFAASLSAGAGYTWSVPAFTNTNLIQRPIYASRWLTWNPTLTGFSSAPTNVSYRYLLDGASRRITLEFRQGTAGTSNATGFTVSVPYTAVSAANAGWVMFGIGVDNNTQLASPCLGVIDTAAAVISLYKDSAGAAWTNSGNKRAVFVGWYEG